MTDIVTGSHPQTIISGRQGEGYSNGYSNGEVGNGLYPFLLMQRMEAGHADLVRDISREGAANSLATEKTAAATQLAVEKIGAAAALAAAQNTAAVQAAIAACCCKLEATILNVESNRIRDDLNQTRAELLALQARRGNGNGA